MEIKVRYYGQLQEITGVKEASFTLPFDTIGSLRAHLITIYPDLKNINFKIAHDNKIDSDLSDLNGTLIDLLPPFSGG